MPLTISIRSELTMTNINVPRVLLGGMVAGLILFAITGAVNGGILSADLETWSQGMGKHINPPARSLSMWLWALMSLIVGTLGVWIYAGTRPRFGAGPWTAVLAGLALWVANKLAVAVDFLALGLLPARIVAGQLIGGLVAILIGVFVGARFYRE
jgi:hypothetical protein